MTGVQTCALPIYGGPGGGIHGLQVSVCGLHLDGGRGLGLWSFSDWPWSGYLTLTTNSSIFVVVKPSIEALREYVPGGTFTNTYPPAALVCTVREDLSVTSLSVTVTPAITAHCGSEAVPTTVPALVACANAYPRLKSTDTRSIVSIVRIRKREIGRSMWSPPRCF